MHTNTDQNGIQCKSSVNTETNSRSHHEYPWSKWFSFTITVATFSIFIGLVVVFFHLDRSNEISRLFQSTGALGILIAIFLMALLSILPVPSEFLMIVIMKVFGPWLGIIYSWSGGAMIVAIITFFTEDNCWRHLSQKEICGKCLFGSVTTESSDYCWSGSFHYLLSLSTTQQMFRDR